MKQTVEVQTLKMGDKFVLPTYFQNPLVYVVVTVDPQDGRAECVCINNGAISIFGRECHVVPVEVAIKVKNILERPPVDLTNKCGSCVYATAEGKFLFPNTRSYVQCTNPNRKWHREISAYRPRTTKCCSRYKAKEV